VVENPDASFKDFKLKTPSSKLMVNLVNRLSSPGVFIRARKAVSDITPTKSGSQGTETIPYGWDRHFAKTEGGIETDGRTINFGVGYGNHLTSSVFLSSWIENCKADLEM
jgi:hypothetical protein